MKGPSSVAMPKNPVTVLGRPPASMLQRQCACGQHIQGEGECQECAEERMAVQRHGAGPGATKGIPSIVHQVLRSPGHQLDSHTRGFMEFRFGHDFSMVRVHTDSQASDSARAVSANAYTTGNHVAFREGQYSPGTQRGDRLIAHELTHVLQQNSARNSTPSRIDVDQGAEREADRIANQIAGMGGKDRSDSVRAAASAPSIQRQPAPASSQSGGYFTDAPIEDTGGCIQPFEGNSLDSLLKPNTFTVVEFGATWCQPCKVLTRFMAEQCTKHKGDKKPMRFFSIDVDANPKLGAQYAQHGVPQLYVFAGRDQKYHGTQQLSADFYSKLFDGLTKEDSSKASQESGTLGLPRWAVIGLSALAVAGLAAGGLGIAAAAGASLSGGLIAGVLGGGALAGGLLGLLDPLGLSKRTRAVGAPEADALIRKHFGQYVRSAGTSAGPLHGAQVQVVTQSELKMLWSCRNPKGTPPDTMVGWTDQGSEDASDEQDPVCANKQKLKHASLDQPVVYYASDHPEASVLIHEGLHTYEHPNFSRGLRNFASEGATEYFAQQIQRDERLSSSSAYSDNEVKEVKKLVDVIQEDALRKAFFQGDFGPANRILGNCGLESWALDLQISEFAKADELLTNAKQKQKKDYCK